MRILQIHNKYGKFSGEESVLEAEKLLLEKKGNEVLLYSRSSEEIGGFWGKVNAFVSGFYNYRSILEIKKLLLIFKPDIVHIHNLYPFISPTVLLTIQRQNTPIVMTVHNYRLICPNGLFFTKGKICERCAGGNEWNCIIRNCEGSFAKSSGYALRNFYARKRHFFSSNISRFICLTNFQKEKLIKNGFGKKKMTVLSNFLDAKFKEDCVIPSKSYIVFSGRVNNQKGFDLIIMAMDFLETEYSQNKVLPILVAGQIDSAFINQFKIPESIQLKGIVPKKEMDSIYHNARFLVFTSRSYEGAPMVFFEAMKHHLPVIAPRLGAYSEIIEDGVNGLLFSPGDYIDLAHKIKILSLNKDLCFQLGENGYQKLIEKYSPEIHYDQLISIYRQVINENS
ncbi:MAG: glycosyltransferase family 4 protein [Bacteroidetes bacterium]|nr:glycosyltransferase family 4 protein [Bacteroidota bacterium]